MTLKEEEKREAEILLPFNDKKNFNIEPIKGKIITPYNYINIQ